MTYFSQEASKKKYKCSTWNKTYKIEKLSEGISMGIANLVSQVCFTGEQGSSTTCHAFSVFTTSKILYERIKNNPV